LIAGNEFVPFFIEAIQQEKITQFGMNGAAFSVEVIDHEHMSEHVTFAKSAYKDSFLALEAVFINKILHSK
jgi:hypothetical protein